MQTGRLPKVRSRAKPLNIAGLSDVSSTNDRVFAIFVGGATDCPKKRVRDSVYVSEFATDSRRHPGLTPHDDHRSISLSCHDVRIHSRILCRFGHEDLGRVRKLHGRKRAICARRLVARRQYSRTGIRCRTLCMKSIHQINCRTRSCWNTRGGDVSHSSRGWG
jgi:hypothetical protein